MVDQTLASVLTMILGTGTVIAVLLQRIPGWENLPSNLKLGIVAIVNVLAPMLLILIKAYLPPELLQQTISQLVAGIGSLVIAFIVHQIDVLLLSLVGMAKSRAQAWVVTPKSAA